MPPKARLLTERRRRSVQDLVDQDGQATVADIVRRSLFPPSLSAMTLTNSLQSAQQCDRTAEPFDAWRPHRIILSVPKKLCTGMKKSESEGPPQNWYRPMKPPFSIQ